MITRKLSTIVLLPLLLILGTDLAALAPRSQMGEALLLDRKGSTGFALNALQAQLVQQKKLLQGFPEVVDKQTPASISLFSTSKFVPKLIIGIGLMTFLTTVLVSIWVSLPMAALNGLLFGSALAVMGALSVILIADLSSSAVPKGSAQKIGWLSLLFIVTTIELFFIAIFISFWVSVPLIIFNILSWLVPVMIVGSLIGFVFWKLSGSAYSPSVGDKGFSYQLSGSPLPWQELITFSFDGLDNYRQILAAYQKLAQRLPLLPLAGIVDQLWDITPAQYRQRLSKDMIRNYLIVLLLSDYFHVPNKTTASIMPQAKALWIQCIQQQESAVAGDGVLDQLIEAEGCINEKKGAQNGHLVVPWEQRLSQDKQERLKVAARIALEMKQGLVFVMSLGDRLMGAASDLSYDQILQGLADYQRCLQLELNELQTIAGDAKRQVDPIKAQAIHLRKQEADVLVEALYALQEKATFLAKKSYQLFPVKKRYSAFPEEIKSRTDLAEMKEAMKFFMQYPENLLKQAYGQLNCVQSDPLLLQEQRFDLDGWVFLQRLHWSGIISITEEELRLQKFSSSNLQQLELLGRFMKEQHWTFDRLSNIAWQTQLIYSYNKNYDPFSIAYAKTIKAFRELLLSEEVDELKNIQKSLRHFNGLAAYQSQIPAQQWKPFGESLPALQKAEVFLKNATALNQAA